MSLNRGAKYDLAPRVELAVQNPRAGLEIRKSGSGLLLPFLFLGDPVM
jgi:hypothetical protein